MQQVPQPAFRSWPEMSFLFFFFFHRAVKISHEPQPPVGRRGEGTKVSGAVSADRWQPAGHRGTDSTGPGLPMDDRPFSARSQGKKKASSSKVKQGSTGFNPLSHPYHADQSTEVANRGSHPKMVPTSDPPSPKPCCNCYKSPQIVTPTHTPHTHPRSLPSRGLCGRGVRGMPAGDARAASRPVAAPGPEIRQSHVSQPRHLAPPSPRPAFG